MNINKQDLENHEVKLNISLDAEEFEPMCKQAARKIASSVKIPGFRPGKAPYDIVRRNYGQTAIAQEALDTLLEDQYESILKQAEVEPGGMGRLDKIDQLNPPIFSIIVPLAPSVDLGDYREIREEYTENPITEDEIKKALNNFKQPYATMEPAEGEITEGESVYVEIKGEVDSPVMADGSKELFEEMPYQFVIGQDGDADSAWPYPDYTKCLIGHKKDDIVVSEYIYPEDSPMTTLRNHKAIITTNIQEIKKLIMPEETDEFAKNFGEYDSYAAFFEDFKKHLQEEKNQATENSYVEKVIDKMVDGAEVKYAPAALEEEVQESLEEIKQRVARQGIDLETYLKMKKTDLNTFIENEIKPTATKQLKRKLVLQEFSEKEKIQLDYEKFKEMVSTMKSYAQQQLMSVKTKRQKDQISNQITNRAINESYLSAVASRLTAIAKGENPAITSEDPAETAAKAAVLDASGEAPVVIDSNEVIDSPKDESNEA